MKDGRATGQALTGFFRLVNLQTVHWRGDVLVPRERIRQ